MQKLVLVVLLIAPAIAQPADPPKPAVPQKAGPLLWENLEKAEFIRIRKDADGTARAMDTSVVRFVPFDDGNPVEYVDLVGVVHVGERAYFDAINKVLGQYDVVLFELAHKDDPRERMRTRGRGSNPFSMLNPGKMLGLASQLDHIDYQRDHFVHADTSLIDAMERRGDDFITVFAGLMADMRRQSNLDARDRARSGESAAPANPFGGLLGFGSMDRGSLKRQMAEQLASQGMDGLAGLTTLNSLLITERNKVAMARLHEQVAKGKKRIAIFYGAGHMRDFTVRLVVDRGLRPRKIAWMEAWDLREKPRARGGRRGFAPGRQGAHDLLDEIYDMLEELMKEPEPPRRRRRGK